MLNKAMIIGNLGQEPRSFVTDAGNTCMMCSIATSERSKGKDGEWQERTEWHNVVAWGRLAEVCIQYLHKGSKVYVEGKLQTRKYADMAGVERYTTEIVAKEVKFLDGKGERYQSDGYNKQDRHGYAGGGQRKTAPVKQSGPPPQGDEDVPF